MKAEMRSGLFVPMQTHTGLFPWKSVVLAKDSDENTAHWVTEDLNNYF